MERILGPCPKRFSIQVTDSLNITLDSFVPSALAPNQRLIEIYDRLAHARSQLSYDSSGIPSGNELSFDKYQINHSPYKRHPYRSLSFSPRALELAGYVRTLLIYCRRLKGEMLNTWPRFKVPTNSKSQPYHLRSKRTSSERVTRRCRAFKPL
jgi:hypothetical protein